MEWEQIDDYYRRAKITGGWIIEASADVIHDKSADGMGMTGGWDWRIAICFVPDPKHEWRIK